VPRHTRRGDLQQEVVGDASESGGAIGHGIPDGCRSPGTGWQPSALPPAMVRAGRAAMIGVPPATGRERGASRA
jgi:hypothetical protein